jgi:hypothetical protein
MKSGNLNSAAVCNDRMEEYDDFIGDDLIRPRLLTDRPRDRSDLQIGRRALLEQSRS